MVVVLLSVRPSQKTRNSAKNKTQRYTLHGAWWVTLKYLTYIYFLTKTFEFFQFIFAYSQLLYNSRITTITAITIVFKEKCAAGSTCFAKMVAPPCTHTPTVHPSSVTLRPSRSAPCSSHSTWHSLSSFLESEERWV